MESSVSFYQRCWNQNIFCLLKFVIFSICHLSVRMLRSKHDFVNMVWMLRAKQVSVDRKNIIFILSVKIWNHLSDVSTDDVKIKAWFITKTFSWSHLSVFSSLEYLFVVEVLTFLYKANWESDDEGNPVQLNSKIQN